METQQVLDALKPKASSFGFSEEELRSASESIAALHPEEANEEEVTKAVENYLPILKLSQSAANRSFERLKTQFEKENPKKTPEQEEAERKAKEEADRKKKEDEEKRKKEEPEWFKAYREASEKRIKELEEANKKMASEKTDADFRKSAIAALEGVDESYYGLLLKSKKFEKQEDVDNFVTDVKEGWKTMSEKLKLDSLTRVRPPKAGNLPSDKPSADVQARIERRKKAETVSSPIRGLDSNKK